MTPGAVVDGRGFRYRVEPVQFRPFLAIPQMSQPALATATFFGATNDRRSPESVRFEQLRNAICGARAFMGQHELFSPLFAELLPTIGVVEPDRLGMSLPVVLAGEHLAAVAARDIPGNDFLNMIREDMRPHAYRTSIEMITRPCGVWERIVALSTDNSFFEFEVTGFPVVDEARDACQIAFLVRASTSALAHPAEYVAAVEEGIEGGWIDLGHGIPEQSPLGFL